MRKHSAHGGRAEHALIYLRRKRRHAQIGAATMNGRQSFTPDEFIDRLKRDELSQPIVLYGMVKPAESDDYLFFAHGSVCQNWIRIPMTSIEAIDLLNFVP